MTSSIHPHMGLKRCVIATSVIAALSVLHANAQTASDVRMQPSVVSPAHEVLQTPISAPVRDTHVGNLRVEVERDDIPADGQTPAKLRITVLDHDGNAVGGDTMVTLMASAGVWQLPGAKTDEASIRPLDADAIAPGVQVVARNGVVDVWLKAPIEAQTVDLQISAGRETATGQLHFIPALRDMIAVGLVDGIVGFDRKNPLTLGQSRPNDGFEDQINAWSRISSDGKRSAALRTAFFMKGQVFGNSLFTMAYDSDKPNRDRLFRDLDPERWYPTYGDSSITGFEARSSSRLYARIDKGRSYAMYGDVTTGDGFSERRGQGEVASTRVRDLGQYSRAFTGLRAHAENDRGFIDGFAAYDNLRQVVEEFPGRGLSGPYTVSNSSYAILGSERVERVIRDRNAPSRIVSVTPLQRFVDYNFEPFSGRILFNEAVPSVDSALNPVSIRISYELEQGGEKFWAYGVNGQYNLTGNFEVGGSATRDENPLAPYDLYSANATLRFGQKSWLRGEYAHTRSMASSLGGNIYTMAPSLSTDLVDGDAWRVEMGHTSDLTQLFGWYGESDRNFNNPASSYLGGRRQAGLSALQWLGRSNDAAKRLALYASGTWIEDEQTDASRLQAQAGVRFVPNTKWTVELGLNHVDENAGSGFGNGLNVPMSLNSPFGVGVVTPGFGGGFFGGSSNAIMPGTGQTLYNTGSSWSSSYGSWVGNGLAGVPLSYTAARIGLQYRPSDKIELGADIEQSLESSEYRRASVGAAYQVHEKTRLIGRYEWNTGLSSVATSETVTNPVTGEAMPAPDRSDAFVFGVETEYMKDGTLFNEYRMYDSFGVRQSQWATGLRNQWRLSPTLSLQTNAERLKVLDGSGQESTSASVGMDWRPTELVFLNGRLEWRTTSGISDSIVPVVDPEAPEWITDGYDSWLSTISIGRKLSRNWTLLARNYYLLNSYGGSRPDSYENRFQIGFAYRDADTNRFNLLGKYENWKRRDQVQNNWLPSDLPYVLADGYDKQILSLHADWHPNRVWWVSGRIAAKDQTDIFADHRDDFRAYLAGGRVTYALSEKWDVSGMGYRMWSPSANSQHALGAEVGRMLTSNLWLSAGYNARGFDSPDLTGNEYTNQGAFIRLRFKFDETLFQRNNPAINRALPR